MEVIRRVKMAKPPGNHKTITFLRIIKTGIQNFVRNAWLSIAAMAVMTITLCIILFSFVANITLNNTISQITDKIDISVYLKDEVDEETRNDLLDQFNNLENVKSVEFISKQDALEEYKAANENNIDLLLAISQTDNPLPASLRIKPIDVNRIEEIKNFIEQPEIKELQSDETSYSAERREAIDNITSTARLLQQAGIIGIFVFTIVSMLIIFNTIQMAIFNRRDELRIMRLLGASTWYIRGPFIVETIFYGIISAIISVSISASILSLATNPSFIVVSAFVDIRSVYDYFNSNFAVILTSQIVLGILIGAVSSFVATRRYLKFKTSK